MDHLSLELSLRYLTWAVYVLAFVLVLRKAIRTPTPAHRDMALFFGVATGLIVLTSLEGLIAGSAARWVLVATAGLAMALPYVLLRLLSEFASTPSWVLRIGELGLAACILVVLAVSDPSASGASLFLLAYFVAVSAYDTAQFARESMRSTGVSRRRMQSVALGSCALAGAVVGAVLANLDAGRAELWTIASRVLALCSGVAYYLGFSPPAWLRRTWQVPALQAMFGDITRLPYLPELANVLEELESHACAVIGAPTAAIGLWQESTGVLRFWRGLGPRATPSSYPPEVQSRGFAPFENVIDVPPDRLFSGRAFLEQRPVYTSDVRRDDPENASLYAAWNVRAVLAAPVASGGRRLGLLTAWSARPPVFAESDLELLQLVGRQVASVLESRRLLEQVADARAREEANHLKDNFLASISHDLRNPLTAASATSQVLLRRLDRTGAVEPERLRAGLESIGSSALQMSRLLDELLDHARLRLDRPLELKQVRTDLVELARRVARAHDSASDRHNIELRVMEDSLVGFWDDERLERVLQNLLSNAIKYSPAGGRVLVHVESENNNGRHWAVVVVQDEGVGIPETELDRVFTPFYRGSNVSQQIAGTGIGLATAREVVQQHGGSISVESVLGTGTTFRIRLPLEDLPSSPGDQSTAETPESENAAGDLERLAWDASPP